MTKRQFVVLAFRLFALFLAFNVVTNIGYILSMARDPFTSVISRIAAVGFALSVSLLLIWLLWKRSEWLMEKVFAIPALSDSESEAAEHDRSDAGVGPGQNFEGETRERDYYETPLSKESIELVAFSVVGLWAVFNRLPYLFRVIGSVVGSGYFYLNWITVGALLPDLVQVSLGLWLFLRPWQFQEWIEQLKPNPTMSKPGEDGTVTES